MTKDRATDHTLATPAPPELRDVRSLVVIDEAGCGDKTPDNEFEETLAD